MNILKALALSSLLLVLVAVVPASAAPVLQPCGGDGLGFGSHNRSVSPNYTPILGAVDHRFVVDLSGQVVPEGEEPITIADVDVVLSWSGGPAADYDLTVNGQDAWNNPIPPETSESLALGAMEHCDAIQVTVWTFVGTPLDTVTLAFQVTE